MNFKEWLRITEGLTAGEPLPLGDVARRHDLIKGGLGGCENLPMGVRSMCEPTTSAFPTGKLPKKKRKRL